MWAQRSHLFQKSSSEEKGQRKISNWPWQVPPLTVDWFLEEFLPSRHLNARGCYHIMNCHSTPGAQTSALSTYYGSRGHKCSSPHLQCTLWSSKHLLSVMTSSQHDRTLPGGRDQVYLSINLPQHLGAPCLPHRKHLECACVLTVLWLFVTQWTVVCQAPLCQARIPGLVAISSSRDLSHYRIKPASPILQVDFT